MAGGYFGGFDFDFYFVLIDFIENNVDEFFCRRVDYSMERFYCRSYDFLCSSNPVLPMKIRISSF